jgi:uncharacterized protein YraI
MNETEGKAMKFTRHLLCVGVLLGAASTAMAKPAYVASTVNLRAAPGTTSEIVSKIPGGSLIDAGECTEGWCEVTFHDKKGFAIQSALDLSGRVTPRPTAARPLYRAGPQQGPAYAEGPEYAEGPPVYYAAPGPYYYGPYYGRPWGWRPWGWRRW